MKPWYQMFAFIAIMLASYIGNEIIFAIYRSDLLRDNPPAASAPAGHTAQTGRPGDIVVLKTRTAGRDFAI
ncbi:MAG: hypothetical protein WD044_09115 [Dongiaceae bacterium]